MKKRILLAAFTLVSCIAFAQSGSGFGLKGGLNYNSNGDYFESATSIAENPDRNVGYHIGVFGKIGNRLFVKPELVYTKTKSDYLDNSFNMSKLDLPVLVGIKVIGPLNVFAGPAFQYILNSEFEGVKIENIKNDFTVGLNIGIGVNLGKLGVDLRYERGFSENEANFINTNITTVDNSRIDTRSDQIILGLSVKL